MLQDQSLGFREYMCFVLLVLSCLTKDGLILGSSKLCRLTQHASGVYTVEGFMEQMRIMGTSLGQALEHLAP